ncbi:hypothetical protein OIE66_35345 [Nonomuraea sp. NBC_01738]|uniref:DUF7158 domain-containing protein n=1 Tax=Nonomuraea sp. NBC_01738 TaxID=2976003 RepID=UPI002E167957|nr:hypothetical protein OIE66_35345 [Nonomuraea sp. NBC_01738]
MIGTVNGRPVSREPLDRRLAELRDGPLSAALPAPGSSEDRQLARWLTQVILTEALCEDEALRLGLAPVEAPPLDRLAAVELGSINAAACNGSPWVRALYEHVEGEIPAAWVSPAGDSGPPLFRVRHGLHDELPSDTALEDLGEIPLSTLPAAIAEALAHAPYGTLVGPIQDHLGWHVATATPAGRAEAPPAGRLEAAARRRAFALLLDRLRAERVELVHGLEHPGDPRQPDNHHKH